MNSPPPELAFANPGLDREGPVDVVAGGGVTEVVTVVGCDVVASGDTRDWLERLRRHTTEVPRMIRIASTASNRRLDAVP